MRALVGAAVASEGAVTLGDLLPRSLPEVRAILSALRYVLEQRARLVEAELARKR